MLEKAKPCEPEGGPLQRIKFVAGAYKVTACLHNHKISFEAYSEEAGKMFKGSFGHDDIKEGDLSILGSVDGVYIKIDECVNDKTKIDLSDAGLLSFEYVFEPAKKIRRDCTLEFNLEVVEIGEVQKLAIKVDRIELEKNELDRKVTDKLVAVDKEERFVTLEAKDKELEAKDKVLGEENKKLTEQIGKLSADNQRLGARVVELERFQRLGLLEGRVTTLQKAHQFDRIVPVIDMGTANIGNLTVANLEAFGNKGTGNYHPCFLTNKLEGKQSFEVQILAYSSVQVWIGIAIEAAKPNVNNYGGNGALSLDIANSRIFYENGKTRAVPALNHAKDDKIMVRVDKVNFTIEWLYTYPLMCRIAKTSIPADMRDKVLYPVVHLGGSGNDKVKFL